MNIFEHFHLPIFAGGPPEAAVRETTAIDKKLNTQIGQYYKTLAISPWNMPLQEGAVSVAFQILLADTARGHHWTLIPQLSCKQLGKSIRPDGTLKDPMGLLRTK